MIEQATLDDLEDIYRLICVLEDHDIDRSHFIDVYQEIMNSDRWICLVYRIDGHVGGWLSLIIHRYLHHDQDTGEIVELVVDPQYRNLKIGHQLIDEIEEYARSRQLEEIELSTSNYRKDAHRFYQRHDYINDHYNFRKKL